MKEVGEIEAWFTENGSERNVAGMARFGINVRNAYGIPVPMLRKKAKEYRGRHDVALALWRTGIHEARIMAPMIADHALMTITVADQWVGDFDSWDVCDQCCLNLLAGLPFIQQRIEVYAEDDREFVRRAAFALIAALAVHGRDVPDERFVEWMSLIERYSQDGRNFVKKAVNWALRQTGKRSMALNAVAVSTASRLAGRADKTARWIGSDALRELSSERTLSFIAAHRK